MVTDNQRQGLRVRILTDTPDLEPGQRHVSGVIFLDNQLRRNVDGDPYGDPVPAPTKIRVTTDYVARNPWIEPVNAQAVAKPAGPPSNPWGGMPPHVFLHADELVLHMLTGDFRYKVVGQPDKYDADGVPTDVAGDPTTEVRWFYDADLIEGE